MGKKIEPGENPAPSNSKGSSKFSEKPHIDIKRNPISYDEIMERDHRITNESPEECCKDIPNSFSFGLSSSYNNKSSGC